MSPSGFTHLIALPTDIQNLIIAAIDAPDPLFVPQYYLDKHRIFNLGNLDEKHKDYYGDLNDEQLASSAALLKWSSTCRFYRNLLGPLIFGNVILRAHDKSLASCDVLAVTDHWQDVASLVVCGTYVNGQPNVTSPGRKITIDPLEGFDFGRLSCVLSNLPPNLRKLTLDFPTEWGVECDTPRENGITYNILDDYEQPEETLKLETTENWRKLIFTVFSAVAKNDLTSKQDFELSLFNFPPLPCSAYTSSGFQHFLNNVTGLFMSFSHFNNGAGWTMNTMGTSERFASNLGTWFWNHLAKLRSLSIEADYSWPFGLAPGTYHVPLALPDYEFKFQHLASLSLKWWFIDSELISLLNIHMPALTDLNLANYFADSKETSSSYAEHTPTWDDFFTTLAKHPMLKHFTLFPHLSGYRLLDPYDYSKGEVMTSAADELKSAFQDVQTLETSRRLMKETGSWTAKDDARMKRIWPHVSLDDKYGMIFDSVDYNAERYDEGSDHETWLKLCEALEQRGGGCKVVDPTP